MTELSDTERQMAELMTFGSEFAETIAGVTICDDVGQGLAADKTARLKAIAAIEGTEGRSAVTVNVNQTANTRNVQPGYIIRLPAKRDEPPAIEADPKRNPLTIDHEPADRDAVTLKR